MTPSSATGRTPDPRRRSRRLAGTAALPRAKRPRQRVDWARLSDTMRRLAAGDVAALEDLWTDHGDAITKKVAAIARRQGFDQVAACPDEAACLARGALLIVQRRAAAWDPTVGVLPWTYVQRELASFVAAELGHHTDPLPDHADTVESIGQSSELAPTAGRDTDLLAALTALAHQDEAWAGVRDRLAAATSNEQHQQVLLEFAAEKAIANPTPAVTVSVVCGVSEANARQIHRRLRHVLEARDAATLAGGAHGGFTKNYVGFVL